MAAVSIPRSAALDALKAAGGDAAAALAWQLMRFRLNRKKVDALAWEYAVARCARAAARTPLCVVVLVYSGNCVLYLLQTQIAAVLLDAAWAVVLQLPHPAPAFCMLFGLLLLGTRLPY